jgi:TPR repeat protein
MVALVNIERRCIAMSRLITLAPRRLSAALLAVILSAVTLAGALGTADAGPAVRQGVTAMARQDYPRAVAILSPLAQNGDPAAQAYLGYLYAIGRGVPQNYTQAAIWYRRAADQGHSGAQYELGLLYDKGQGVPVNVIQAEKWLILATATAPKAAIDDHTRMRDAVRTKMTVGELAQARMEALAWRPRREEQ